MLAIDPGSLTLTTRTPITAIVYKDGARIENMLAAICDHLTDRGVRLGGFIQRSRPRPGRLKCDMFLEVLSGAIQGKAGTGFPPGTDQTRTAADSRRLNETTDETGRELILISEDRGPLARGCRLNASGLLKAGELARQSLASRPGLFIVNKFGKAEHEGSGIRPLISEAVMLAIPVLIAVPARNLKSWREFSEGLAANHPIEQLRGSPATQCRMLGLVEPAMPPREFSGCLV